jgi:hypothetical protein
MICFWLDVLFSRWKTKIKAKSASRTAPIEIPTIAPVDNLINNRSAQWIGLIRRKHIPDPELPELRYSD